MNCKWNEKSFMSIKVIETGRKIISKQIHSLIIMITNGDYHNMNGSHRMMAINHAQTIGQVVGYLAWDGR